MRQYSNFDEELYILYRKIKALLNSFCFYIFRLFPIDYRLVAVCTFEGKGGFGCNPKYVVEEMHKRNKNYKFVWFVNDMDKSFPAYIKKVPNTIWSRAFWLTRAAVWIDNYRKPYGTVKRRGQYYLNTNHYTIGIKTTGLWRGDGFSKMAYLVSDNDSKMIDDLIIDSKWCEDVSPKGLVYEGNYLKTGAPRCDILFGNREYYREIFKKKHNLPKNARVVMFAPTFREGKKNGVRSVYSQEWTIDFKKLRLNLEKKYGAPFYICLRVHPQLADRFEEYCDLELSDRMINESGADDMYEILAGMDIFVTDYSSACFEAAFARIPVFIYADDIEKYSTDRGALMWDLTTDHGGIIRNNKDITPNFDVRFPFSVSSSNEELEANILNFDNNIYNKELDVLFEELGLVFGGNASQKVVDRIVDIIG